MNTITRMPKTARELGDMAERLGMTAVELLEALPPIPTSAARAAARVAPSLVIQQGGTNDKAW
jgi:hypothetical protein